jgi:hypothetical protein
VSGHDSSRAEKQSNNNLQGVSRTAPVQTGAVAFRDGILWRAEHLERRTA